MAATGVELACTLAAGAFTGAPQALALNPAGDEIWAAKSEVLFGPTRPNDIIGRWSYPSGAFIGTFGDGDCPTFDTSGNAYWCDRMTNPASSNHIRKGTSQPGTIIYSQAWTLDVSQTMWPVWHGGYVYFTQRRLGGSGGTRICRIDDDGSNFVELYDGPGTDPYRNRPIVASDGAVWAVVDDGDSIARIDGSTVTEPVPGVATVESGTGSGGSFVPDGVDVLFMSGSLFRRAVPGITIALDHVLDSMTTAFTDAAWTPDRSTVLTIKAGTREVWRLLAARRRFWVGSTGFSR